MTIIAAAISREGAIYMGGDGASIQDESSMRLDTPAKVWRAGEYLMGATGTLRVCQIVRYLFVPPTCESERDLEAFMVREFAEAVKASIVANGGETKCSNGDKIMDGRLLVGFHGAIFEIDCAYGVLTPALKYHAIGCASQVAMGAMYAYKKSCTMPLPVRGMIQVALEASAEFDMNIRRPFTIECINGKEDNVGGN